MEHTAHTDMKVASLLQIALIGAGLAATPIQGVAKQHSGNKPHADGGHGGQAAKPKAPQHANQPAQSHAPKMAKAPVAPKPSKPKSNPHPQIAKQASPQWKPAAPSATKSQRKAAPAQPNQIARADRQ